MTGPLLAQTLLNALVSSATIILISLGLSLIYGIMHIMNFMHGELYMLGAFGIWGFFGQTKIVEGVPGFFLAMLLTMALIAILGMIIERILLKRFRGDLLSSFIVCLGLILIMQTAAMLIFGKDDKGVRTPFPGLLQGPGFVFSNERLVVMITAAVLIGLVFLFIQRFKAGRAMRAVAQDSDAAQLQGISIDSVSTLCMGIGCALAAAAGVLLGPVFYINPFIGADVLIKAFVVIILGGMGSVGGTMLGGLVVGFVDSFGGTFLSGEFASMILFGLLIVVLIIRPTGLFGVYYK